MRSVCFVKHLEFEFTGSIFNNAIALGDVDNDGEVELIVGNMNGDLFIFKHDKCWQKISNLGMITAIGIGDIMNCGSNALVIVSGDGWCHICLCLHPKTEENVDTTLNVKLEPVHVQRVPPNTKALLLEDVDGDGSMELVLGLTDRVVRSYRWVQSATGGRLVCLFKWECANQIGGLAMSRGPDGKPNVLVSQPGGTVMRINPVPLPADKDAEDGERNDSRLMSSVEYHSFLSARLRNPGISAEIVGDLNTGEGEVGHQPYVVATLDGSLMFIKQQEIVWSYQVDHQLFALSRLDVTGDKRDEVIACSWDGKTYILDLHKNTVCFHLEEAVSAFCAGFYTLGPAKPPSPCFVYVTFSNKILIYYDIRISSMVTNSVLSKLQGSEELAALVGEDVAQDKDEMRKLIQWCLYGDHS